MVSKKGMQKTAPEKYQEKNFEEFKEMEEHRTKEALVLVQKKHELIKCVGERERARIMQKAGGAIGPRSGGHDYSSFGSCSPALALHTNEAKSASSRMAQEVDEATSESSWTALAKERERHWWSIDLEGEVEKLEVIGPWSGTEGDSVEPKGEMGHKPDRAEVSREEKEKLKKDEMKVDVDTPQGESVETKSSKRSEEPPLPPLPPPPRPRLWNAGNQPGRSRGMSLCCECRQRATRIHLFLRQSLQ